MRLFGSLAVLALVSFFFMPDILAQNDAFLGPPSGCGAFSPGFPGFALLYEARPLALRPPASDLPSLRVHAGDLAIYIHLFSYAFNLVKAAHATEPQQASDHYPQQISVHIRGVRPPLYPCNPSK